MDGDGSNLSWYFRVLLTLLFLQKSTGCQEECSAIGIDNSNIIPDSSFTANSELRAEYGAKKARFSSDRCWEPRGNSNPSHYLQIDLGKVFVICAVATKGNAHLNEWTTEYKISTSTDGNTWIPYSENNNSSKLFAGNTDKSTAVKHDLATLLLARFIRFIPTKYKEYKALRVEVFQSDKKVYPNPCSTIGLDDSHIIPDSSFTASSELRDEYGANKARFSSDPCWQPKDNKNANDYLQIDLGKVFVICAVATKGSARYEEWTTEYKISTSSGGSLWITYSENNNIQKLFNGNTDKNTAVKNDLTIPVLAKLIRFTPTKYKSYKSLRVEVYGFNVKDFSCSSLPVGIASVAKIPDYNMTTSFQYNASTPASNGRLSYTAGSSWCAAKSDSSPYLQVELGSPYIICGVATQGDHKSDNWVQTYQIQTSTDGSSFTDYKQNNAIQDFGGNTDRDTIVMNPLYEGAITVYVRIKPKSRYGPTSCMRTELYGVQQSTACSKMSIGVPYANLVRDHRFSASSYYGPNDNKYIPSNARLRTKKAWEPLTDDSSADNWLQIDLGSVVYACAVATQGNAYNDYEYAKKYKLKISLDNVKWEYYKENNADKEFTGNTDTTTIVTNSLATPTKTKFLRFYPTDFKTWAAMRVDVYGVPTTCSSPFGLEKGGSIKDSKMTSSSQSDSGHAASVGRLYGSASWCSNVQNTTEYLQVDLDKMVTLTGIATQGDKSDNKWVKTYTLKYSVDGNAWNDYRGGQASAKLFQGNSDKSSIVVRWLTHPVTVRYVRVIPQTWHTGICMRIELFGCTCPSSLEIKELSNKILPASSASHVDLECTVNEPLIKYIYWYSDNVDVTNLSGGITRNATSVRSVLRVNFTNADNIFNRYKCLNTSSSSSMVACRKNIVCRANYVKVSSNADSLKSAQVLVNLEKPSALTTPSVPSILSKSVVVSWTQPRLTSSQASIISYAIKYWQKSTVKAIVAASKDGSKNISGLSPCTEYNVSITSYSVLGPGPWSGVKTFRTDSEKPTVVPGNVQAQPKTSQSILVTWQVPAGVRCSPSGYKVTFTKKQGVKKTEQVNDGQATSTTLDNLEKYTEYSITVLVFNDKGDGPASSAVVKRTLEDIPEAPPQNLATIAKSPTQIDVSWDPPSADKQNGIIRGYKLSYCKTGQCSPPIVTSVSSASTTLNGLAMYAEYTIKVLAYTNVGDGPYSKSVTKWTLEGPPSKPTNVKTTVVKHDDNNGPQVIVQWDPPSDHNGIIRNYVVSYGPTSGDENKTVLDSKTFNRTFKACGGVTYKVKVWAITVTEGLKVETSVAVPVYAPTKASIKTINKYNTTTYNVILQSLPDTNGRIITYEMKIVRINDSITQDTKFVNVSCVHQVKCHSSASQDCSHVLYDLPQCATYAILVRAYTSEGPGLFSDESTIVTSAPGSPRDFKVLEITQTTAKLNWSKPQPLARPVEKYIVSYRWEKTYLVKWPDNITSAEKIYDKRPSSQDATFTLAGLYPDTRYHFSVSAETECGKGNNSDEATGVTDIAAPPAPSEGIVNNITFSIGNITLWTISAINGKISGIIVYVREVKKEKRKRRAQDSSDLKCEEIAPAAAVLSPSATIFTLGDGKMYEKYKNKELEKGKSYEIFQCGKTGTTTAFYGDVRKIAKGTVPASTGGSDQNVKGLGGPNSAVIASVVSVLLILIIGAVVVILFILWKRRRERDRTEERSFDDLTELDEKKVNKDTNKNRDTSHNNHGFATNGNAEPPFTENETDADLYGNAEAIRHQPIPAHKFNQYVNERRETLKDDFKLLSSGQAFPCTIAKDPKHKPKNRYANIITYDHSRVILEGTSDGFDYINASYIHGYDGTPRTYIATQGPNPLTVEDFWHMVWQEKITTIVMLTNLIEAGKVKCHQYWPDSRDQYGQFSVTLHRSDILADYVVRIFILSKEDESESRQVHHYQYTSWPDKGVPQHATSVLGFRRKVKAHYTSSGATAPLLVHCSAGVGRTGAFIAVDAMMERVKKDKSVDIFNYVQLMRNNRCTMVQTDEQYAFVHLALQEAITCGNTEIPVLNLNIAISRLSKERPKDGQTGFEVEWKRLAAISPKVTPENSRAGRREQNLARNRYPDIIPFDSGRVFLSQEHQNYINASFGDAYRERNAFVMAQTPLDNTISDFWHMIHQYKIGSIVVLNKQEEDETFPKYWPSQGSDMYEGIKVEMISSSTRGLLVISKFMVTHPMEPQSPHTVLHIQHTDWPVGGAPEDSHSVLDIVDQVQKSQQKSGNAPITVVCSDGVGRSGTFCAIYSLLERVKSEQVIDVFQAIKVLRLGRPNAVATLEQYQYCYRVVQIYLDSFNDYANFSEV